MRRILRGMMLGASLSPAPLLMLGPCYDAFAADGWTYTLINSAPLGAATGGWRPTINNVGQLVYFSEEETVPGSGVWREGIHVSDGLTDQTVLEFLGPRGSLSIGGLGLDDSGNVAFYGRVPGEMEAGSLLYRVIEGQAVRVPIVDPEIVVRASADLNERGELALQRSSFLGEGLSGERMRVVDANDASTDQFIFSQSPWSLNGPSAPVLNDRGEVGIFVTEVGPFVARLRYRLWRRSMGLTEDILLPAEPGQGEAALGGEPGFNDRGFASTSAFTAAGSDRILFWVPSGIAGLTPGVVALIDTGDPDSPIAQIGAGSSLTNNNTVAFSGFEAGNGPFGIFIRSPGGEVIPVVRSGESIVVGSGVVDFAGESIGTRSLNEHGQLAFVGRIDDERRLVRAEAAPGLLPDRPVLPDPGDLLPGGGWILARPDSCLEGGRCWFDPPMAIAYRFTIDESDAGAFADVTIPAPLPQGDALFTVDFNGITVPLVAGETLAFSLHSNDPVREFVIAGIDEAEALDSEDPTAFVTGLRFIEGSSPTLRFSMVPIPEPGIAMGAVAGFAWIRSLARRRPRR